MNEKMERSLWSENITINSEGYECGGWCACQLNILEFLEGNLRETSLKLLNYASLENHIEF